MWVFGKVKNVGVEDECLGEVKIIWNVLWSWFRYVVGIVVDYVWCLNIKSYKELVVWNNDILDNGWWWFWLVYWYCNWESVNVEIVNKLINCELSLSLVGVDLNNNVDIGKEGGGRDGVLMVNYVGEVFCD